jgi:hypothetical protein
MLLAVVLVLVFLMFLGYGGVALPALIVTTIFIGFWVTVIRLMIGFGRWVFAGFEPQLDPPARARPRRIGAGGARVCRDSLCRQANPADARYCARCGKRVA